MLYPSRTLTNLFEKELFMKIRTITKDDADGFISLAKQLGYHITGKHVLEYIANNDDKEIVFVAGNKEKISGWIDCKITGNYFIENHCEIEGLVVDEKERGTGIGKALLQACEKWAKDKGINEIVVRSNIIRERAHTFYLSNGYEYINQSKKFCKNT
jgi:GNAT superfamily N-acetyltransferase